jgi:protein-tyrosine phosphatase
MLSVLMVCTGNICRSPLMELSLRGLAERSGGGVVVTSAGTRALEGEGMPQHGLTVAAELGLTGAPSHVARQLTPDIIAGADLILVATSAHVSEVAIMNASSLGKVFSLRSFSHLVRHIPQDEWPTGSLRERLAYAAQRRDLLPFLSDETSLDIPDPFRRSLETYQRTGDVITREVESLAPAFGW